MVTSGIERGSLRCNFDSKECVRRQASTTSDPEAVIRSPRPLNLFPGAQGIADNILDVAANEGFQHLCLGPPKFGGKESIGGVL